MKLWLARHAQPLIAPGICYGATDIAAEPQATREAAHALAQRLPPGLPVVSSSLQRCEQLSQFLRGLRPDLIYTTEARLVELDFGCWEGQRWDGIAQVAYNGWTADFGHHRFGGRKVCANSTPPRGGPGRRPGFGQCCVLDLAAPADGSSV